MPTEWSGLRLLTSGSAAQGKELIAELVRRAGDRLIVMPGAGINDGNIRELIAVTSAREYHLSGQKKIESRMVYRNAHVFMGVPGLPEYEIGVTDEEKIRRVVRQRMGLTHAEILMRFVFAWLVITTPRLLAAPASSATDSPLLDAPPSYPENIYPRGANQVLRASEVPFVHSAESRQHGYDVPFTSVARTEGNVKGFGARADGRTDCTMAFYRALASVTNAARPAEILFPSQGRYYFGPNTNAGSDALAIVNVRHATNLLIRGQGHDTVLVMLTASGIAASVALLVLALQWGDSIDYLAQNYFFQAQRQHLMIGLPQPQASTVVRDFEHMRGVLAVEPMRIVRADFANGPRRHRGSLSGIAGDARLQPIFDDARGRAVAAPPDGLVLSTALAAKRGGVAVGDAVWVKILEGRRPEVQLPVVDLVETYNALPAYIHLDALNRLLKDRPRTEYLNLLVDRSQEALLYRELKELPMVSAVMLRQAAIDSFYATIAEHMMVFISMFAALACALGCGVAYNSTRVALSERGRELATLRVLGFTRGETAYILLGEVALLIAVALPLGCLLGRWLSMLMAAMFDTELFRVPLTIEPSTYGYAVMIAVAAAACSAALVGVRVGRLDLIEVLKTRE